MEKELNNLKEISSQFSGIHKSLKKTNELLNQLGRNAKNSQETLNIYSSIQKGVKSNLELLENNPKTGRPVIDTIDQNIEEVKNRIAFLKAQLDK